MHFLSEHNILIFLVQVLLLLALARGLGELFRRWKQPPLTAELLVGLLLGPAILGRLVPGLEAAIFPNEPIQQNMLETVAWLGVLFLLLQTGLEIDFISAWSYRNDAVKIAVADVIIPMALAFAAAMLLPNSYLADPGKRIAFALFIAVSLSTTAVPVAARALHDLRLTKTDLGFLIMSALSVNDFFGWVIFAVVLAVFTGAAISIAHISAVVGITIVFTILSLSAGRMFASWAFSKFRQKNLPEPGTSLTLICILGLLCGTITMAIGIHALYGFFIAGIMAGQSSALPERTRQIISQMVNAIFVPLFFANIGLKIDFVTGFNVFLCSLFVVISFGGRFLGAWAGLAFTNVPQTNRLSVAIAHTPGGAMEIVMGIIALQYGLITESVFVAIVFAAAVTSIVLGPLLNYSIEKRKKISVLEFFSRNTIIANLKETNRDDAIGRLCTMAAEHENLAAEENLCRAVLVRERAAGTAMEEGIAVPHARVPFVNKPIVVFGRSPAGIEWNSPDGKPANFIFFIVTPQQDLEAQVQILGSIARAMSDPKLRESILNAHDTGEIWQTFHKAFAPVHIKRPG